MPFCCFYLTMMCGWLPPCHDGAADCRPGRFLLSVSSCTSSLSHLHASSLLQPFFQYRDKKGVQSHIHFAQDGHVFVFKGRPCLVGVTRNSLASVSRPESSTALRCGSHGKGTMGGEGGIGGEPPPPVLLHADLDLAGGSPR